MIERMRSKSTILNCFSPPVMLATMVIELGLACWVLYRYRQTRLVRIVVMILVLLAVFQLAEFNVCTGYFGVDSLTWARVGFVAITALPALGIHALLVIARQPQRYIMTAIYALMLGFMLYFAFAGQGLSSSVCGGNYVIFETTPQMAKWYSLYYYGLEVIGLVFAWRYGRRATQPRIRQALYGFAAAYLVLLVPTTTVNVIYPETIGGIPSIMCGFAVFLALIVALYVLPRGQDAKHLR